jgi:hypothetical protein
MAASIPAEQFASELLVVLDEAFDNVHGIFLDHGTSMFETLATISHEEASRPVSARCATLAAQVNHVRFYLDVVLDYLRGTQQQHVDWPSSWQITGVTGEEWDRLRERLRASYQELQGFIRQHKDWTQNHAIGGAIGVVAHCAYHLGEIRQALCTLTA